MDVVKVAKTPGTVGPVIKHLSGWEDVRDGEGGRIPVLWKGNDHYDASTEYGGIILKVDGSSWFGGSDYISGEGLLIGDDLMGRTSEDIDGGDNLGHTCPFVKAEKQIDQPRT